MLQPLGWRLDAWFHAPPLPSSVAAAVGPGAAAASLEEDSSLWWKEGEKEGLSWGNRKEEEAAADPTLVLPA